MGIKTSRSAGFLVALERQYPWIPITVVLAIATALFTYRLGSEGIWIDEFFSIRDATAFDNPLDIYKASRLRPLYYILLSFWMKFGSSDAWLRSLSVIFAIVSVFLIYRLGCLIAGKKEGLIAAILLSSSPLFINHAQEVRMYALSLCMTLAGTLFLANALLAERPQAPSQKTLAGWALFRLLAICTVPLNLVMLLPDALLIFVRFRKERRVLASFGLWTLAILALWSPAIVPLLKDANPSSDYAQERLDYSTKPGLTNLFYPLKFWMVWPFVVYVGKAAHFFYKAFTLLIAGLVGAGLLYKRKSPSLNWIAVWFVVPLVPIVGFSLSVAQIWEPRYVLFASPYLFILMAAGFTRVWKDWKRGAIVMTALYVFGIGGALTHYYTVQNRADYRFNIETITQYERPGDTIIWAHGQQGPFEYYYKGGAKTYFLSDPEVEEPNEIQAWVNSFPTDAERTWLVVENMKPIKEHFEEIITNKYTIEESFNYAHGSAVFLLKPIETIAKTDAKQASTPAASAVSNKTSNQ